MGLLLELNVPLCGGGSLGSHACLPPKGGGVGAGCIASIHRQVRVQFQRHLLAKPAVRKARFPQQMALKRTFKWDLPASQYPEELKDMVSVQAVTSSHCGTLGEVDGSV